MSEKKNVAPVQQKETTEKATKPAVKEEKKTVIWLGPAIAGVAMTGTVYKNGLTPQMQKLVTELPAAKRLLVETKDTARARKALGDQQSAESICYQQTLAYAGKGERA